MNIFLTGASSGIGQALAKEFAANGATLGLVARREDKLKELIAELPNPELHTAIVCDVTDRDRLIEEARKFDELRRSRYCGCLCRYFRRCKNTIPRRLGRL